MSRRWEIIQASEVYEAHKHGETVQFRINKAFKNIRAGWIDVTSEHKPSNAYTYRLLVED